MVILNIDSRLAREMGKTLTCDVTRRQSPWLQCLCESLEMVTPHHRDVTPQTYYGSPERLEKCRSSGRCRRLWEESEMGLWRKINAGI